MVRYLFEKNIIIDTFVALCGIGIVLRLMMNMVYNGLIRETDNMSATKNKQLGFMKMKFEAFYKLKIGVNNVDTFVDKNLLKHRFCGILLSTWDNLCGQVLFSILLLVPVSIIFGAAYHNPQDQILLTGAVGLLTSAILIIVDKSINFSMKKEVIKLNLLDYLDNFCKARMEKETFQPEVLEQLGKEYKETMEPGKQVGAAKEVSSPEPKNELDKRREAKRRKEEEKKMLEMKREEEKRQIEEARKQEEKRKMEERRKIAVKRREEEIKKSEEERLALEAKREADKKADTKTVDMGICMEIENQTVDEIAAEQEGIKQDEQLQTNTDKSPNKGISSQEEKVIEDILREFFA